MSSLAVEAIVEASGLGLAETLSQSSTQADSTSAIKPLRLLVLGGGAVVSEFYLPALERLGWTAGITITDASPAALDLISQRANWVRVRKGGYREILEDPGVRESHDAVVVALPNSLHVPAVLAALNAGFPVLCEKPLALKPEECEILDRAAIDAGLPLTVGMVRRLTPAAQAARTALDANLIGVVEELVIDHGGPYAWTSDSGTFFRRENGGILSDLGVHHLDWLEELLGPLTPVAYEDDCRGGVEASCDYELRSAQDVRVRLRLSHRHRRTNTTIIRGQLGELVLEKDNFASCSLRMAGGIKAELTPDAPFAEQSWPRDFVSCFAQQFHDFAKTVRGLTPPATTAGRAAATMSLIQHAYDSRPAHEPSGAETRPTLPSGRVVVTGGTGFIGAALIERLTDCGFDELIVPVRGYRTVASVSRFPVELPRVDLTNRDEVRAAVKGARWVFHLAYGQTPSDARRITEDGTRIVVEEAAAAGAEAVVVLSTMYVFGHPNKDSLVDESWPYAPAGGDYGKTKMRMERWCLRQAPSLNQTRLVVLNPSCVFGPEGKTYTRLPEELAQKGQFVWVEEGKGIANYVFIDNLIDAMLLVAAQPEAHGKRFIVNDGSCTWREFLAPMLSRPVSEFASYTTAEFESFARQQRTTLRQVAGSLLEDQRLRDWLRERSWFQPFRDSARSYLQRQGQVLGAPTGSMTDEVPPPSWLADLFAPTVTRFSSEKLRGLGWQSRVGLETAQRKTVEWLDEMGFHQFRDRL